MINMKPTVYIETTIISYLTARPSRDIIIAAHQRVTDQWWFDRREQYELFISQAVIDEASVGNQDFARRRLEKIQSLPLLDVTDAVAALAEELIVSGPLPEQAAIDAVHIAAAAVHGMDFLLTWNLKHIANASMRNKIEQVCRSKGYRPPVICTPEELLGE